MTSSLRREVDEEARLDESYVQDAFHSYLKSSLTQAKVERLLDVEVLSSAEGDLMITGAPKPLLMRPNAQSSRSDQGPLCASTSPHYAARLLPHPSLFPAGKSPPRETISPMPIVP